MSKRVLIVDESASMRLKLRNILTEYEYEVVGMARNSSEAISLYKWLKPDLVTMGITMTAMNRVKAIKAIFSIDSSARIVMLKAVDQQVIVENASVNQ